VRSGYGGLGFGAVLRSRSIRLGAVELRRVGPLALSSACGRYRWVRSGCARRQTVGRQIAGHHADGVAHRGRSGEAAAGRAAGGQ